tara:strand:+ start:17119 stop:17271 length:153 start_codon:yes stop_codon:yes gene_type:complete
MAKSKKEIEQKEQKEFEKYCAESESLMWKGIVFFVIVILAAVLLWGIVHK